MIHHNETAMLYQGPLLLEAAFVAFLHVPKTGGTTLIMALAKWAEAKDLTFFHDHGTCDRMQASCRAEVYGAPTRLLGKLRGREPVMHAAHHNFYGQFDAFAAPHRSVAYVVFVRQPKDRLVSMVRQFPPGVTNPTAWWYGTAKRRLGESLLWRTMGVPLKYHQRPTESDWAAAVQSLQQIVVLLTERYAASARMLDALAGGISRGPTFAELTRESYRCFDASHRRHPGAKCDSPHSGHADYAKADPAVVFRNVFDDVETYSENDQLLYDLMARTFDARAKHLGVA